MLHCTGVAVCENLQFASSNFASIYCNFNYNTVILTLPFLKCNLKFFYMLINNLMFTSPVPCFICILGRAFGRGGGVHINTNLM